MRLKKYQEHGIKFLTNNETVIPYHSILGDDMGLGKTAQAIVAAERVGAKKILIICPSSVKINWMREILKWSKYTNIFVVGASKGTIARKCRIPADAECVIVNYELCILPAIQRQLLKTVFDVGILDECHYLMNTTSGRTSAILAKGGIIWNCKYKWPMSGTFMKNRNRDTFPILRALFPFVLGKYTDYKLFAEKFCGGKMGKFGYEDTWSTCTEELGQMLSPIMLRRTKAEVLSELPEVLEQNTYLEITPEIASVISEEEEFSEEDKRAILNFEMQGRTASYRKLLAMAKLPQVITIAKEILSNVDKLVIFAYHRDFIDELANRLASYGVEVVKGGLTAEQKQEKVDNFINNPTVRVFIGQLQAAGTGTDGLQFACSNILYGEIDWVPGTMDQSRARLHRIGQKNKVHVEYALVPDSLEESMLNTLRNKKHNIKSVMSQVEKEVQDLEGEEKMTLEVQMERIANALEEFVSFAKHEAGLACSCPPETQTVEPAAAPKKSRSKAKAVDTPVEAQFPVLTPEQQNVTTEQIVNEVVATATAAAQPTAPTTPAVPKVTKEEVTQKCIAAAGQLSLKVGKDPATIFIQEVTAQITGVEGARISGCTVEQASAVLDAIESKLNEGNVGEI